MHTNKNEQKEKNNHKGDFKTLTFKFWETEMKEDQKKNNMKPIVLYQREEATAELE